MKKYLDIEKYPILRWKELLAAEELRLVGETVMPVFDVHSDIHGRPESETLRGYWVDVEVIPKP